CAAGRISDEELQFAKSQLRSQLRAIGDNPARLEELYLGDAVGPIRATVAERTAAVEAVTADDVAAAARTVREDTVFFLKGAAE
ncbi:MAG: insulinase family protein, partial [Oscillospiraceae bacterium]|nr:insulinase family protein [Oscillospiraceae bacterium]